MRTPASLLRVRLDWSRSRLQGLNAVIAHTLCQPNASTRVLEKCGFARDGFGEDPDEGQVWRWKLTL